MKKRINLMKFSVRRSHYQIINESVVRNYGIPGMLCVIGASTSIRETKQRFISALLPRLISISQSCASSKPNLRTRLVTGVILMHYSDSQLIA